MVKERMPIIVKLDMIRSSKTEASVKRFIGYLGHREGAGGVNVADPNNPGKNLYEQPARSRDRWWDAGLGRDQKTMYETLATQRGKSLLGWSLTVSLDGAVADLIPREAQPYVLRDLTERIIRQVQDHRNLGEIDHSGIFHWKENSQGQQQPHTHTLLAATHVNEETGVRRDFVNFEKGTSRHLTIWREEGMKALDLEMERLGIPEWRDRLAAPRGSQEERLAQLQQLEQALPWNDLAPISREAEDRNAHAPDPEGQSLGQRQDADLLGDYPVYILEPSDELLPLPELGQRYGFMADSDNNFIYAFDSEFDDATGIGTVKIKKIWGDPVLLCPVAQDQTVFVSNAAEYSDDGIDFVDARQAARNAVIYKLRQYGEELGDDFSRGMTVVYQDWLAIAPDKEREKGFLTEGPPNTFEIVSALTQTYPAAPESPLDSGPAWSAEDRPQDDPPVHVFGPWANPEIDIPLPTLAQNYWFVSDPEASVVYGLTSHYDEPNGHGAIQIVKVWEDPETGDSVGQFQTAFVSNAREYLEPGTEFTEAVLASRNGLEYKLREYGELLANNFEEGMSLVYDDWLEFAPQDEHARGFLQDGPPNTFELDIADSFDLSSSRPASDRDEEEIGPGLQWNEPDLDDW